ncbi:hypothetical protein BJ508DRAFT_336755 [Ascobolus immersus RN42]|uniref:Uncharacterized protein n=1 Tax=Ascobolus immersus RN42 TaxID=1160509 RepID=A0A3N4H7G5_ASCIM|nr:hypothetical protein BJ508DRAFT_336755 [Ascobolus immersus RN42]
MEKKRELGHVIYFISLDPEDESKLLVRKESDDGEIDNVFSDLLNNADGTLQERHECYLTNVMIPRDYLKGRLDNVLRIGLPKCISAVDLDNLKYFCAEGDLTSTNRDFKVVPNWIALEVVVLAKGSGEKMPEVGLKKPDAGKDTLADYCTEYRQTQVWKTVASVAYGEYQKHKQKGDFLDLEITFRIERVPNRAVHTYIDDYSPLFNSADTVVDHISTEPAP